jgi:hypothetical protein
MKDRVSHNFTGQELQDIECLFFFGVANRQLDEPPGLARASWLCFQIKTCFDDCPFKVRTLNGLLLPKYVLPEGIQ